MGKNERGKKKKDLEQVREAKKGQEKEARID